MPHAPLIPNVVVKDTKGSVCFTHTANILCIDSKDDRSSIIMDDKSKYLTTDSFPSLCAKLEPHGFVNLNNRKLVNPRRISGYTREDGVYYFKSDNGITILFEPQIAESFLKDIIPI